MIFFFYSKMCEVPGGLAEKNINTYKKKQNYIRRYLSKLALTFASGIAHAKELDTHISERKEEK